MTIDPRTPVPVVRFNVAVAAVAAALGTIASVFFLTANTPVPPRSFSVVLFTMAPTFALVALPTLWLRAVNGHDAFLWWAASGLTVTVVAMFLQLISFGSVTGRGGVFATTTNNNAALGLLFHLGLPLGVLAGVLHAPARAALVAGAGGIVGAFVVATNGVGLPTLVSPGTLEFSTTLRVVEVVLILLTVTSFTVCLVRLGASPRASHGWVVVTLPLIVYELVLGLLSTRRFDSLWWSSLSLRVAAFAVLAIGTTEAVVRRLGRWEEYTMAELDRREAQLRAAATLSVVMDAAEDAIFVVDTDRRVMSASRSCERLFGWQPREAVGRTLDELGTRFGAFETPGVDEAQIQGALRINESVPRRDGTIISVEGRGTQVDGHQVWVVRDVTDRIRLEAAERQLQEANAAAAILQRHLLPTTVHAVDGISIAVVYRSAGPQEEVGGDWYDTVEVGADALAVVIGDVEGHDLTAAALMGQIRAAVRSFALEGYPPSLVLDRTNDFLSTLRTDRLVTMTYAIVYVNDRTMTISSAGHPPVLVTPSDGSDVHVLDLSHLGPPIGAGNDGSWGEETVRVPPGSSLIFYTDGLVEAAGRDFEEGLQRVAKVAEAHCTSTVDEIASAVASISDDVNDDLAVLVARLGDDEKRYAPRRRFPAQPITVSLARRWLLDLSQIWITDGAIPDARAAADAVDNAALLLTELAGNAIRHSDIAIEVVCALVDRCIHVEVYDTSHRMPHFIPKVEGATSGRGLHLVDALATAWGVEVLSESKKYVWFDIDIDAPAAGALTVDAGEFADFDIDDFEAI